MSTFTFSYQIPEKSIGGFVIDVFREEKYNFSNDVTDIPVEDGSTASDHVVTKPCEIQISAFIGQAEFVVMDGTPQAGGDPRARIRAAYHELLRLKNEGQPLDLVTGLGTFPNMVITSFDISREVETGADLPFDMTFKEIRVIKSETVKISASSPSANQVAPTLNKGVIGTIKESVGAVAKEAWRFAVRAGRATPEEYQKKWGVPYPQ